MAKKKLPEYVVLKIETCPEVVRKVLEAKQMLQDGRVKSVTQAVQKVNISRSVYYKYCKDVFSLSEIEGGKHFNVTIIAESNSSLMLRLLNVIKANGHKLVTTSQTASAKGLCHVSFTLWRGDDDKTVDELALHFYNVQGVRNVLV